MEPFEVFGTRNTDINTYTSYTDCVSFQRILFFLKSAQIVKLISWFYVEWVRCFCCAHNSRAVTHKYGVPRNRRTWNTFWKIGKNGSGLINSCNLHRFVIGYETKLKSNKMLIGNEKNIHAKSLNFTWKELFVEWAALNMTNAHKHYTAVYPCRTYCELHFSNVRFWWLSSTQFWQGSNSAKSFSDLYH